MMIDQLLEQLEGVRREGRGYVARCPAHEDHDPSLGINPGREGWLINCLAGCNPYDIMAQVGLSIGTLFYNYANTDQASNPHQTAAVALNTMIATTQGANSMPTLYRFFDVAWHTLPQHPRRFDQALNTWWDEVTLPYWDAMRYWIILRDGWLWDWMGEAWLKSDRRKNWREVTEWMSHSMDRTSRT